MVKILIDNGHGVDTQGKCSPDHKFREYKYCREIAQRVVAELKARGFDAERIVTEEKDISLDERCRRVNNVCAKVGAANVVFVSIHVNAAGSGKWLKAGGWCAYTTKGKTKSDKLADKLYEAAKMHLASYAQMLEERKKDGYYSSEQKPFRTDFTDGDQDIEANFYVIKNTRCPAVLTENLFMDNLSDMVYLMSDKGKKAITDLHVDGIISYVNTL